MYRLQSVFLKKIATNEPFLNYPIADMKLSDIFNDFIDGYFVLTHTQLTGTFYMLLSDFKAANLPIGTNLTFNQWLGFIGNLELPASTTKPQYHTGVVTYSDSILAGFEINRVGRNLSVDANIVDADKVDLLLVKNTTNQKAFYRNMLVTVDGFLHRTQSHPDGIAVVSGGETFNTGRINTVGVLSFLDCAEIQQLPITPENLSSISPTTPLVNKAIIKVGQSLSGKSVLLVIGGYLITDPGVCNIVSSDGGIINLNVNKLNIPDMIFHSSKRINLEGLDLFMANVLTNNYKFRMDSLADDVIVRRYLTLPQSFLVIIDAPYVVSEKKALFDTGLSSVYELNSEPVWPIVDCHGRLPEYWKQPQEDGIWKINITNDIVQYPFYHYGLKENQHVVNQTKAVYKWFYDKPQLLKISVISKPTQ